MLDRENHTLQNAGHIATVVGILLTGLGVVGSLYFNYVTTLHNHESLDLTRQSLAQNAEAIDQVRSLQEDQQEHEAQLIREQLAVEHRPELTFTSNRYDNAYFLGAVSLFFDADDRVGESELPTIVNLGNEAAYDIKASVRYHRVFRRGSEPKEEELERKPVSATVAEFQIAAGAAAELKTLDFPPGFDKEAFDGQHDYGGVLTLLYRDSDGRHRKTESVIFLALRPSESGDRVSMFVLSPRHGSEDTPAAE